jgi:hypothetical protein
MGGAGSRDVGAAVRRAVCGVAADVHRQRDEQLEPVGPDASPCGLDARRGGVERDRRIRPAEARAERPSEVPGESSASRLEETGRARIARLELALVPTHPDRAAGLGFREIVPLAFVAPAFAIASVLSARWAHDVVYHAVPLRTLAIPLGAFVVVTALFLLVPLLVFTRPLWQARRQGLLDYGALIGEHQRRLRRRWVLNELLGDDAMLRAPDIWGPAEVDLGEALMEVLRTLL